MTEKKAELLLAAIIIARSSSYLLMKTGLESMGPFTMLAVRFLLAFAVLLPVLLRHLRGADAAVWGRGALLGGVFFIVMATQTVALKSTGSSTVSFIESTAIVFVPLLEAAIHRKPPSLRPIAACALCVAGVGLLTLKGGGFALTGGELLCLCSALCYAAAIILTGNLSRRCDPVALGVFQVGFIGVFSLAAAFAAETPRLPATPVEWGVILALAIVCSAFGFTLQPVAQRYVTAERAGQFCALTPLSAAVMGAVFLHERLGAAGFAGAALILLGIISTGAAKQTAK